MQSVFSLPDEEYGIARFTIGPSSEVKVDIAQAINTLADLGAKHQGNLVAFHQAVVEYMVTLGFPTLTHAAAIWFQERLQEAMTELKKTLAHENSPDSCASTTPE